MKNSGEGQLYFCDRKYILRSYNPQNYQIIPAPRLLVSGLLCPLCTGKGKMGCVDKDFAICAPALLPSRAPNLDGNIAIDPMGCLLTCFSCCSINAGGFNKVCPVRATISR